MTPRHPTEFLSTDWLIHRSHPSFRPDMGYLDSDGLILSMRASGAPDPQQPAPAPRFVIGPALGLAIFVVLFTALLAATYPWR